MYMHNLLLLLLATTTLSAAEDYTITLNTLGIGNQWRAGDVTPIQIEVGTNLNEAVPVWIEWEVPDADGDHVFWGRPITLVPQGKTSTWLYAPTRPWDNDNTSWTVRLRSFENGKPTKELSSILFSPQSTGASMLEKSEGSIAIFGTRRLGLSGYQPIEPFEPKQEATKVVSGLTKDDLPNAWPSYLSLDALVWADTAPEFSYQQSEAIVQWVERGGHFIITLPTIGDPWLLGSLDGPLASMLTGIHTSVETVHLSDIENALGRTKPRPSFEFSIRVFGHLEENWSNGVTPLTWLDDGRVIVIQKTVGFGAVTIIGVDLANGRLASLGLPEPDVLWNRVLGRRSDTPSQSTLQTLDEAERFSKTHDTATLPIEKMAAQEIAMSTTAVGRLGTVFLIIVSYWLISGPIAFFILRRKCKQQWSWIVFTCTACVFTVGTWFVAANASSVVTPLKHVTIVDHVYGGSGQRAVGWFSLYLPNFGRSEIQLLGDNNNLLLPWTPPSSSMTPPFVDRREIVVNLNHVPSSFEQPSRATTANFSFQWKGGIDHEFYDALIRIRSDSAPSVRRTSSGKQIGLSGEVMNRSSVNLEDVTILWITGEQQAPSKFAKNEDFELLPWVGKSGQALNIAYMWRMPSWGQEPIELDVLNADNTSSFSTAVEQRYKIEDKFGRPNFASTSNWRTRMEMLSLYSHLQPPTYKKQPDNKKGVESNQAIRESGRDLDFAEWFGRPCLIIMGFLPNAPIPVPISIDGEHVHQSNGVTFVRWIYPLPLIQ